MTQNSGRIPLIYRQLHVEWKARDSKSHPTFCGSVQCLELSLNVSSCMCLRRRCPILMLKQIFPQQPSASSQNIKLLAGSPQICLVVSQPQSPAVSTLLNSEPAAFAPMRAPRSSPRMFFQLQVDQQGLEANCQWKSRGQN